MQNKNLGTDDSPKWFAVTTVIINGEEQEIIPAFTEYSIKRKDFSKDKIFESIDETKVLPTIFCLTDTEVFKKEGVKLFDFVGRELDAVPEGAPQILVYLDKADNINLWNLDTPLNAEVVKCDSVADAYHKVATTAYLSQSPSKDDWVGLAGVVSKDELLISIRKFSNDYCMSGTTAQGYFNISTTTSFMQSKAITMNKLLPNGEHRTYSQAKKLMEAVVQAFGAKSAKQTRYIRAINYCIATYDFDLICQVLENIGATEKIKIEETKCEGKMQCIQGLITKQAISIMQSNISK